MVDTGWRPADVDECMKLGAGMPMGPIALIDFVGLDVSRAIGETIGADVPAAAGRARGRRAPSAARSAEASTTMSEG